MRLHKPVLLQSACQLLDPFPGGKYIDATYGNGGHTDEIIRRGGLVLGIDQDCEVLPPALTSESFDSNPTLVHANFMFLEQVASRYGFNQVNGIIFDLGVSSIQLDRPERGFSFQTDGPLDMRMDRSTPITAADLVNNISQDELRDLLRRNADIRSAKEISRKIISHRPYSSTKTLAVLLENDHLRRQVFQALRIAVNAEILALQTVLPQAYQLLAPKGCLVVISFHSLEDRIVKNFFRKWQSQNWGKILTPKPIRPSPEEIKSNPRSKSGKLRAFKKN